MTAFSWHFPAGSTADGRETVRITPELAHWGYTGLREWLICDDPARSWVRQQWGNQPVDPRVSTWGTP